MHFKTLKQYFNIYINNKVMPFKITFIQILINRKQNLYHCPFFFRSFTVTLRNVLDRALTSAVIAFHSFCLSLFDKVDLNRPCNSSYFLPYVCIKAPVLARERLSLLFRCCLAASALLSVKGEINSGKISSQNVANRLSATRAGIP